MNDFVMIEIDNQRFALREHHDFQWLAQLGTVFAVFAEQDSGNLCFGVTKNGAKQFVKYAGAKTMMYEEKPEYAVEVLQQAVLRYEVLQHPHLVTLQHHFPTACGYAAIFDWFSGESLHMPRSFPGDSKYTEPRSPFHRYRKLSVAQRLASLHALFSFHVHVEAKNYVAIDFYDGSILYDFDNHTTKMCDIDLYSPKPYVNKAGRMWGSSRFMAPEEVTFGAVIDEKTNVFAMGAAAFVLLGDGRNRSFTYWEANKDLYEVARKAIQENREERYTSVKAFFQAWCEAGGE
ncbi:serine/threonine-protein kinase [Ectobacillus sp. JY-23]|uniref:serine/threonine-protein kinase n=1 Tax=Ectobacillus sp. JY-23 TaxID=2933872 RepID=UPI001FF3B687|nr:serine/threonine-protein kinase [Ectobacillus sp. JY-23]UOY93320.1 serine/threonine-protein kinase [Ectobacillus sp. JY-23]